MAKPPHDHGAVFDALVTRRSVRGFRPDPVPLGLVRDILTAAARAAPSATNTQPWHVHVLTGEARARLSRLILQERAGGTGEPAPEYPYYPAAWPEPYLTRRRTIGWQLYGLLGIVKGDRAGARAWHDQNFSFFGAPVGMMFTLDRRLSLGSYLDIGMFMQSIMIAARGLGLDTCPQAAFAGYHEIIRRELELAPEELLLCGMALGWADHGALANTIESERAALEEFAVFRD